MNFATPRKAKGFLMVSLVGLFLFSTSDVTRADEPSQIDVFIGTYTQGNSRGIYRSVLNLKTGNLTDVQLAGESDSPSFLAIHPSGKFLYAVNEFGKIEGHQGGTVSAFAIDKKTRALKLINRQPSLGGAPCQLIVDQLGKHVLLANYHGGSVTVLPIAKNGRLKKPSAHIQHKGASVNPRRQKSPHAHSINLDAANRFAFAADLGLDKILIYRFDKKTGALSPAKPASTSVKPGAGPRHFAFHPDGKFAYVINEIQSTVTAFGYDAKSGTLTTKQTISTLPDSFQGNSGTAEVQVHPSGKFLYGSNRGHDSIAVFTIDDESGRLKAVQHQKTLGRTPRGFGVDPSGKFLLACNQSTNTIVVFRIDPKTGKLSPTGHQTKVPAPVCVKFLPRSGS